MPRELRRMRRGRVGGADIPLSDALCESEDGEGCRALRFVVGDDEHPFLRYERVQSGDRDALSRLRILIDDLVEGLVSAAERGTSGRRYLIGHENLTYQSLLGRVGALVGRAEPRVKVPRAFLRSARAVVELLGPLVAVHPGMRRWDQLLSQRWYGSARLAIEELGLPQTPIDDGIRRTLESLSQAAAR